MAGALSPFVPPFVQRFSAADRRSIHGPSPTIQSVVHDLSPLPTCCPRDAKRRIGWKRYHLDPAFRWQPTVRWRRPAPEHGSRCRLLPLLGVAWRRGRTAERWGGAGVVVDRRSRSVVDRLGLIADRLLQRHHMVVDLRPLLHERRDLVAGVHHRGVISTAELAGNMRKAQIGQLTGHVHRHLPGDHQGTAA